MHGYISRHKVEVFEFVLSKSTQLVHTV
jgi:hypothetical protein